VGLSRATRLDEMARGEEEPLAIDGRLGLEAEQEREPLQELGARLREHPQLLVRKLDAVVVEDPRDLLHVLRESAVGGALAVGDRAASQRTPALCRDEV